MTTVTWLPKRCMASGFIYSGYIGDKLGINWGYRGVVLGIHGDNGKENGKYYLGAGLGSLRILRVKAGGGMYRKGWGLASLDTELHNSQGCMKKAKVSST